VYANAFADPLPPPPAAAAAAAGMNGVAVEGRMGVKKRMM
jgi:hypothetical protein